MIFILHYILFGGALPAAVVFLSIYLQTYSTASMSEIGALLKLPAFVLFILKPLVCGLADRHQAHRYYLMGALACMALGYGSLTIAPFFPCLLQEHGALVWHASILGVMVGSMGHGLVWSLGDALAINGAEMAGVDWGTYRLWPVVSWGLLGAVAGQVNELPVLPRFVPGMLLLVVLLACDILLLAMWPKRYFVMYGRLKSTGLQEAAGGKQVAAALEWQSRTAAASQSAGDTQTTLLRFIAGRDKLLICHLVLLTIFGFASSSHLAFFYLNMQKVCEGTGLASFATISGGLLIAHSTVEVATFLLLPRIKRTCGQLGTISLCASSFFLLTLYHGSYLTKMSPYYVIPMEGLYGLAAAIMHTLLKDAGLGVVNRVDSYLAELIERKLVEPDAEVVDLKRRLRATMHGLMGGAMDGLGGGLGTLAGGIIIDLFGFGALWQSCAVLCLMVALLYPLAERWARSSIKAAVTCTKGRFCEANREG